MRLLQAATLPEALTGKIFNLSFKFLNDPDETATARIYSMTVLSRICRIEPELAEEVALLIRQNYPHASAGFKSRAKKTLRELAPHLKNIRNC